MIKISISLLPPAIPADLSRIMHSEPAHTELPELIRQQPP